MHIDEKALKPCPFCGKDAQIAPDEIGSGGQHVPPYHAGCFRGAGCGIAFTADNPDEAIAEWNRRTLSTVSPAGVGGLAAGLRSAAGRLHYDAPAAINYRRAATALEAKEAELAAKDAEISRLIYERDVWRSKSSMHSRQAAEARAALAEARKALEPFAEAVDDLDDDHKDTSSIWECPAAVNIEAGHLRAARRALTGGQEDD